MRLDYIADRPSRSTVKGDQIRSNKRNWSIAERTNGVGQEGAFLTIHVFTYHYFICGRIVADENCKERSRGDRLAYS
jgi:hypothetical protein